jgi:hypothetical protein
VEAEAAAHHFDTDVLKYRVQTALWPYLPPGTRGRAFVDSFADRASAGPSSAMVDIMAAATFTPVLPAPVVVDLLEVSAGLGDPDERVDTLTALLPHAAARERVPSRRSDRRRHPARAEYHRPRPARHRAGAARPLAP